MGKLRIILLFLLVFLSVPGLSQITSGDDLLHKEISEYGQARITIGHPGIRKINELSEIVSVTSVRESIVEITLSPLTVEKFLLLGYDYNIVERPDYKSVKTASSMKGAMEWESYPAYTQYDSIMRSFANLYPSLCLLDTIGTSINGKLILVLKISDNVTVNEDEPETFYSSSIHGDETGGFILMLRLADFLLKNYTVNSRVRDLVDNLQIWINPLANPDGSYRLGNVISSPTRYNANGYDLNRNFPDPETPGTTKQKETLDMVRFMRDHKFVISINFHSGAEVVNYPWDRWYRRHADDDWFHSISSKYADTVHFYGPAGYMTDFGTGVTNGYDWYKITGGRQDFITWELQGREVTIELDYHYVTPPADLNILWQSNWRSLIGYLENATFGIHGKVKNANTGDAVKARIFITGHDKDSSHVYSNAVTGSFVRLLAPGTWDLLVSANGYVASEVNDVVVTEGVVTEIEVELTPILNPVDTADTAVPVLYPNPGREYIKVVMPWHQIGDVNIVIYNSNGRKLADYYTETFQDIPLYLNIRNFAGGVYYLIVTNTASGISNKTSFIIVK